MVRLLTLLFAPSICAPSLLAQDLEPALGNLNELFSGSVQLKIDKKHQLVIDIFDATGRFRQDIVGLELIDPATIHFSLEEDAVIIGCLASAGPCFTKEIFKLNTIRRTGRCNLPRPPQDPGGDAVMEAFRALISAAREHMAAAGETRGAPVRMK